MKKKTSRQTSRNTPRQRLLNTLFKVIIASTPLNLMLCFMVAFHYGLKTSSNAGTLAWFLMAYSVILPFIALWAKHASVQPQNRSFTKKTFFILSIIGIILALTPAFLACIVFIIEQLLGFSLPLEVVFIPYLSVYPLGGIVILITCLLSLPLPD